MDKVFVKFSGGNWILDYVNEHGRRVKEVVAYGLDAPIGDIIEAMEKKVYPTPKNFIVLLPSNIQVKVDQLQKKADSPSDIKSMPDKKFLRLVNDTVWEILELEKQIKPLKKLLGELDSVRLYSLLEQYNDKVVELEDVVVQLATPKERPKINYREIVAALLAARPELKAAIDDLKAEQYIKKTAPKRRLLKHIRGEEPETWKELHRVKLSQIMEQIDETALESLLVEHIAVLDAILENLYQAMEEESHLKAASLNE